MLAHAYEGKGKFGITLKYGRPYIYFNHNYLLRLASLPRKTVKSWKTKWHRYTRKAGKRSWKTKFTTVPKLSYSNLLESNNKISP